MRETALTAIDRLAAAQADAEDVFAMDEEAFRVFYERTSRPLWAYLARAGGDARLADDLLQDTYYRFLRARTLPSDDAHRRHYLFRIASNLLTDAHRRPRLDAVPIRDDVQRADAGRADAPDRVVARMDVTRALSRLKPRERDLLWLAYANGSSHQEIAAALGLKTASIKALLFRAKRRLAGLLRERGR